jgi:hypothetical protein
MSHLLLADNAIQEVPAAGGRLCATQGIANLLAVCINAARAFSC